MFSGAIFFFFLKLLLCNFSVRTLQHFQKKIIDFFFAPKNMKKPSSNRTKFTINYVLLYWRHLPARLLYNDFVYMYSFYISMHAGHKPMNPPTSVTMPPQSSCYYDVWYSFFNLIAFLTCLFSIFLIDSSDQLFLFVTTWHIILFIHNSRRITSQIWH